MVDIEKLFPRNMSKKNKELLRKADPVIRKKVSLMKKEEPEMVKFATSKGVLPAMLLTWLAGKGHIK